MSTKPVEDLQLRALEQRNQLHHTVAELKSKVSETRERFDVRRNLHAHFGAFAGIAAALSFLTGYGVGTMFTQR
jgi:MFS-type transporter involved in bile tolerance (Atg22 family)